MKIEVWSDIACPFCYLGKKKLEKALNAFPGKDEIKIVWKSFQLNPEQKTETDISLSEYLARVKNSDMSHIREVNSRIQDTGREYGLTYNFDRAIPANTMKAHMLLHLAKKQNRQNEVKEELFRAYFTDGKNVDDVRVLSDVAEKAGLNTDFDDAVFEDDELYNEVRLDRYEASQFGIKGVPFFMFNNSYTISGAHPDNLFTETLKRAYSDWKANVQSINTITESGESCSIDGVC